MSRDTDRDVNRDDDAQKVSELAGELPALDVDSTTAEQIARKARASVGRSPSRRRWIVPIIAAVLAVAYAVYLVLRTFEVLG